MTSTKVPRRRGQIASNCQLNSATAVEGEALERIQIKAFRHCRRRHRRSHPIENTLSTRIFAAARVIKYKCLNDRQALSDGSI